MPKIKFSLKRPDDSMTSIYARIPYGEPQQIGNTLKYNYLKYYISESINPEFWNTKTSRAKNTAKFKEFPEFNQRLDNVESMINTVLLNFKKEEITPDKSDLKTELDKIIKPNKVVNVSDKIDYSKMGLVEFTEHLIKTLPFKHNTIKSYNTLKGNLVSYEKKYKTKLTFKNTDIDFYNSFVKYLTGLGLGQNTIGTRIKIIKTILNNANERGLTVSTDYQKKSFSKPSEETENVYLNETELTAIYNLNTLPTYLESVRDMFLIGCYTGLRYSDLIRLTKDNITSDNTIKIKTEKTEKTVDIPIHTRVKQIFEKYDYQLPKPISNQKYNDYIKLVVKHAGIKEPITKQYRKNGMLANQTEPKYNMVTSHTARRSFATNAFLADVPTLAIMKITGHKTESSFMKYIKMSATDNAMKLKTHKFFNLMTIAK